MCFRASGYGVRGIEKQKSRERRGRCVYKVYVEEEEKGETQRKYENVYVIYWEKT